MTAGGVWEGGPGPWAPGEGACSAQPRGQPDSHPPLTSPVLKSLLLARVHPTPASSSSSTAVIVSKQQLKDLSLWCFQTLCRQGCVFFSLYSVFSSMGLARKPRVEERIQEISRSSVQGSRTASAAHPGWPQPPHPSAPAQPGEDKERSHLKHSSPVFVACVSNQREGSKGAAPRDQGFEPRCKKGEVQPGETRLSEAAPLGARSPWCHPLPSSETRARSSRCKYLGAELMFALAGQPGKTDGGQRAPRARLTSL